ncbi:lysoplasmalogenase [Mangrovimonas sp. TPBH4]|uniref:lysoplasmalogenase n=1 Tax=Mangrovimonas sp. TPBH4 TaxID=1645914 RepID=UPI0006B41188|nr:lysoplasmalogenase [Mangrovimonas sp. TPBH4]
MLTKTEKSFSLIYFIIVLAELVFGNSERLYTLHYVSKPAILTTLIIFFVARSNHLNKTLRLMTLFALLFSLLGDIELMYAHRDELYFIFGLVAFLASHVMYTLVFLKNRDPEKKPLPFIGILLLFAFGLLFVIYEGLGSLTVAVIAYMLVILTMVTSAYLRKETGTRNSYYLVFSGALLFMLSDSILAIDKFHEPLPYSHISIMFTYALAQYCIILGLLKSRDKSKILQKAA